MFTALAALALIVPATGQGVPQPATPSTTGQADAAGNEELWEAARAGNGEGTCIPTPLFYDGILYTCGNNGVLTAYDGATGARIYRARIGGGSFSASPVAADGRLYIVNEDGDVFVVRAGRTYEELAKNEMKRS